jgi:hypothetical protein
MNTKLKALLASYARSFIVAASAVYATGETNPKTIALAGLVATVGPAIRAINPHDSAFGFLANVADDSINKLVRLEKKKAKK